jgi:hypothetical protein
MAETKEEIAAERDALTQENARLRAELAAAESDREQLRGQLAAAGATAAGATAVARPYAPQYRFQLSEGDRQELEIRGVVNIGGRLMTKAEVEAEIANAGADAQGHNDQSRVEIADAPEATRVDPGTLPTRTGPGVAGVDYVYPSVERGKIDPAVAGTPGINGPSADTK